jgi:hypothetical protein
MGNEIPSASQIETRDAFRLKELEYLRKEIEYRTANQCSIERNVIVAVTAVYVALAYVRAGELSWLTPLEIYLWFIPVIFLLVSAERFFDDHIVIRKIGLYIRRRESQLDPEEKGWESSPYHWTKVRYDLRIKRPIRMTIGLSLWQLRKACWALFGIGTLVVPIVVWLI